MKPPYVTYWILWSNALVAANRLARQTGRRYKISKGTGRHGYGSTWKVEEIS